jgi:hypothetical protein
MAASRSGKPRRTMVVSSSVIGSELQISEKKGVSNSRMRRLAAAFRVIQSQNVVLNCCQVNALAEISPDLFIASCSRGATVATKQPSKQPQNDFGLSDFERPIQSKLFILLVPGGGSNPHDRKGRRILSLFFATLQGIAVSRKMSHKLFYFSSLVDPEKSYNILFYQ